MRLESPEDVHKIPEIRKVRIHQPTEPHITAQSWAEAN